MPGVSAACGTQYQSAVSADRRGDPVAAESNCAAPEPPPRLEDGHRVEWEGWTFNWSLRVREGLVLHDVSFGGRKVLTYAGLAEIFVAFDQGAQSVDLSGQGLLESDSAGSFIFSGAVSGDSTASAASDLRGSATLDHSQDRSMRAATNGRSCTSSARGRWSPTRATYTRRRMRPDTSWPT